MGTRKTELLNEIIRMTLNGKSRKEISKECGISPQYVGRLIKEHERNRIHPPECNYGLSTRILNCLKRNHIPVDPPAIADSIGLLLRMRGIGKRSLDEIGGMLMDHNVIGNIDDWIEEGKRQLHYQYRNKFATLSYNKLQQARISGNNLW
jgi:DNA-directed RNA polymerase alpha subunit